MVLCAKIGKCTLYEQKNPVCIEILRAYTWIRDAETPIPGDVAETRGFALSVPKAKKFKRLATRDTLHGSRPNPRQRDPDGRIVPTPSDVSGRGASTKRYARRTKKMKSIRVHTIIEKTSGVSTTD